MLGAQPIGDAKAQRHHGFPVHVTELRSGLQRDALS